MFQLFPNAHRLFSIGHRLFSRAHLHNDPTPNFEAVIIIVGESGAGKSTLINLIAGKLIADTTKSANIEQYTCTYQDKDTHHTWKLHLLNTPGLVDRLREGETLRAIHQRLDHMVRKPSNINIISGIYCHNINQGQPTDLASRLILAFKELHEDRAMKNSVLCTTQWDMIVDKSLGERRLQELKNDHWKEAPDLGLHLTRHDNTRKSVEEMLRLIIGREAVKLLLLEELRHPQMIVSNKAAFKQDYEGTKRLLQELRSARIKEAADRAKIITEDEESRWQQKFARMSAELERVKTTREKDVIEGRLQKEKEDLNWKRKIWKSIQRAREERIEKDYVEICRRLTEATGLKFIADTARAAYVKVGDTLVSGVKVLKRTLPGEGIEEKKQGYSDDSCVDNYAVDANDKNGDEFVPLQFKTFTNKYAITPELASKKIQNVDLLLVSLNQIFDTNIAISHPGIQKTLEYLIDQGHDLGAVYARMQVIWPTSRKPSTLSKPFTDNNSDYVIGSPELACRKCQDVDELLNFLNMSFNTNVPQTKLGVKEALKFLIDQGYEFGQVCAHMRSTWPRTPELDRRWLKAWKSEQLKSERNLKVWEDFQSLERRGREQDDQRQKSLRQDTIHEPDLIKPRRIWDLYAHRVIPFHFSVVDANSNNPLTPLENCVPTHLSLRFSPTTRLGRYHPVSHSWTENMTPVDSPVNAHEWPVPLPPGVTLEAVRNELLNLGVQYAWLDVVCLRQKSSHPAREDLRMKEWQIDVPTIGRVYKASPSVDNVVRYLNGLGKAFRRDGWQNKTHWSQRAWTLQEVNGKYIEAGLPMGVEDPLEEMDEDGTRLRDHLKARELTLPFQGFGRTDLHDAIAAMKARHSQNPVDKIFGLSALFECTALPSYSKDEQEEDAWA